MPNNIEQQQGPEAQVPPIEIGSVVFILSNKNTVLIPAVVVEEHVRRTFQGNVVSYMVSIGPPGPNQKKLEISQIGGELFGNLNDAHKAMVERLTDFADRLCNEANDRATAWYGNHYQQTPEANSKIDPADLISDLTNPQDSANNKSETSANG